MECLFVEYPKCSTCQKAKKWLDAKGVKYVDRHIVEKNPTKEELREWISVSGRDIKSFFNTSGQLYRQMGLKDKLVSMSEEDKLELLASNGMLVKRPLVVLEKQVLVGFKEKEWESVKFYDRD